jgi:ectoine hydroxylase-related dioxygenase (phytanoyl-CoA dioxygenase family)
MGAALENILSRLGAVGSLVSAIHGKNTRAVRAVLFDKKATMNWGLGWHQDRTIAVAGRIEVAGFGPWTIKDGALHVAPPFDILAGMITVRIHLDDVPETNAPLLIAPGSHRFGRVPEAEVSNVVQTCGAYACVADAGDVWLYATPILHASKASERPARRRVLQVDYAACDLPGGLRWLGI